MTPPTEADVERAQEIYRAWLGDRILSAPMADDIAEALSTARAEGRAEQAKLDEAARRDGAEKMRTLAANVAANVKYDKRGENGSWAYAADIASGRINMLSADDALAARDRALPESDQA